MNCPFCDIIERKRPASIIYEDENVIAFRDIHPMAPVHILIIPRRHIPSLKETEEKDITILGQLTYLAKIIAEKEGINTRGYRLVINSGAAAGQSVPHIHLHLLGGRSMHWPPG